MKEIYVIRFINNGQYYDGSNLTTEKFTQSNSIVYVYGNPYEFESTIDAEEYIIQNADKYEPVEIVRIYESR